jgi:AraC-like DNA-binding protein
VLPFLYFISFLEYLVGYISPAPFSREFKRYFGFVPSVTI